jgi:CBS domain-containing protein
MSSEQKGSRLFHDLLKNTKVGDIIASSRDIITVSSDESPLDGFKKIVAHHVLSAPVWDKTAKQWIGFLDIRDLVSFVVFQAEESERVKAVSTGHLAVPPQDLRTIFDAAAKFYQKPIDGITTTYLAHRNKFIPVHKEDSLYKVAEILAGGGVHRVPVVDKQHPDRIVDIVSQSSLIQFFYKHRDQLAAEMQVKVGDINLGSRPVIPVNERTSALEAFKLMAKYNRSGIAVVDDRGTFVGNTSASDLKIFISNPEKHSRALHQPIMDFLSHIRQSEIAENPNTRSPTIAVGQQATLDKVIGKLAATRIHRIFVADDESGYKPVAVISITDVLRYIIGTAHTTDHAKAPQIIVSSS